MRKTPSNPLSRWIKGIVILKSGQVVSADVFKLIASIDCEVLASSNTRIMVKTTLGNLQSIKRCFLANDEKSTLSQELNSYVAQILIGGNA